MRWRWVFRFILIPLVIGPAVSSARAEEERTVSVRLSSFAFEPKNLVLKVGVPVHLRLLNDSDGGHNFSAPDFFAASTLQPGSLVPTDGEVEVGPHQMVEVVLVPRAPGSYRITCTHFLHSVFGMHGNVEVTP
jgi:plastocyanin